MPTSAMAATTAGLTVEAGADPAERTSTWPPARWVRKPAAIWERPALCTHTNSTDGRDSDTDATLRGGHRLGGQGRGLGEAAADGHGDRDQADQDRDFDERADHAGESLAGGGAEGGDGHRDGQLEVVARRGERQRGRSRIV